eukprot:962818-Rhodomonas_salina.1
MERCSQKEWKRCEQERLQKPATVSSGASGGAAVAVASAITATAPCVASCGVSVAAAGALCVAADATKRSCRRPCEDRDDHGGEAEER